MIDIEKIASKHCIDFYFGDKYNHSDRWIKFSEDGFKTFANELQNEVIERCAIACESIKEQDYCVDVRQGAEAIRNLKVKG